MTNPNIVPSSLVPASLPAPSPQCRVTKPARCISCPPLPRGPCWRPPVHLGGRDKHGFSGGPRGRPGAETPRGSDCSFEHLPSISHFWAASTFLPISQPSGSLKEPPGAVPAQLSEDSGNLESSWLISSRLNNCRDSCLLVGPWTSVRPHCVHPGFTSDCPSFI